MDGRVHGHDELTNLAERLLRQISPENDVCRKDVNPKEKSRRDSEIQFSTFFWSPGIFGPLCGSKISGAFTALEKAHRAKPRLVKVPDMPVDLRSTGIPGNQK